MGIPRHEEKKYFYSLTGAKRKAVNSGPTDKLSRKYRNLIPQNTGFRKFLYVNPFLFSVRTSTRGFVQDWAKHCLFPAFFWVPTKPLGTFFLGANLTGAETSQRSSSSSSSSSSSTGLYWVFYQPQHWNLRKNGVIFIASFNG